MSEDKLKNIFSGYAPDPKAYWNSCRVRLSVEDRELYQRVQQLEMAMWDSRTLTESIYLADRCIKLLGNPFNYQRTTFISSIKKSIVAAAKEERESQRR